MQPQHPSLHRLTVADLQQVLHSPAFIEDAKASTMTSKNSFSVDEIGALLYLWGLDNGLILVLILSLKVTDHSYYHIPMRRSHTLDSYTMTTTATGRQVHWVTTLV